MSCPTETDLLRLVSGELTGQHRERVVAHVEQCAACAQRVEPQQDLWETMGAWHVDVAGRDVSADVLRAAAGASAVHGATVWHRPWQWPVPLRTAASVLLAVGIGWGAGRTMPQSAPSRLTSVPEPVEPVTPELVAREMSLDELGGGVPTGLAITLLYEDEQPAVEVGDEEEQG